MEQLKDAKEETLINNENANEIFFKFKTYFTNKLLLGEFSVYFIDNNMVDLAINDISFRLGVDYYRSEMNMDVPFYDGKFFEFINQEQSKKIFQNISKFGLSKAISDKENLLKQIEQEILIMKSNL